MPGCKLSSCGHEIVVIAACFLQYWVEEGVGTGDAESERRTGTYTASISSRREKQSKKRIWGRWGVRVHGLFLAEDYYLEIVHLLYMAQEGFFNFWVVLGLPPCKRQRFSRCDYLAQCSSVQGLKRGFLFFL